MVRKLPAAPADKGKARDKAQDQAGEPSRADLLDGLLARLYLAGDDPSARVIAGTIREIWANPKSASAGLLASQARKALKGGDAETALNILNLLVRRWPEFADGWRERAVTRFMAGDAKGALRDLDRALALEPRHFEALLTKAAILQELKRSREAMDAYEQVLGIYPGLEPARRALKALKLKMDQDV
jgi:tetratricopeptide (TPR) repeat protein